MSDEAFSEKLAGISSSKLEMSTGMKNSEEMISKILKNDKDFVELGKAVAEKFRDEADPKK